MLSFAKLVDGAPVTTCAAEDDHELIEMLRADGFRLYDEDTGQPEVGPFQSLSPVYLQQENRIVLYWEIVNDDPEKIQQEIDRLEELISTTDYRVIKSYEYALAGENTPYDVISLHNERQALRDQINELKTLITGSTETDLTPPSDTDSQHSGGNI